MKFSISVLEENKSIVHYLDTVSYNVDSEILKKMLLNPTTLKK